MALALVALAPVTARGAEGLYRWPTVAAPVTAHYDNNNGSGAALDWECGGNSYSGHDGTDIGVAKNTDVYAAASGYVKKSADGYGDGYLGSTDGGGFGNHVAIFHGGGDETIYGHLLAGTGIPAMGTQLACGERIGGSGTSGSSTGPHLHFETRVGVDENGSYYSGFADDPYAGPCSGPLSYWVNQNGGTPTADCKAAMPPDQCGDVPAEGTCAGALLRRCEAGQVVERDCAGEGLACAAVAAGGADCVAPTADGDGDGAAEGADCDDTDPGVHPGATEVCNALDDDCSGAADDALMRTCSCGTGLETCTAGTWAGCPADCPGISDDPPSVGGGCTTSGSPHPFPLWLLAGPLLPFLLSRRGRVCIVSLFRHFPQ
jgi:hypothetical protein